jgi:hypothetical protein
MCTTFVECKAILIAVLTVMSGMDPHTISETWDLVWLSPELVFSKCVLLGCGSVTVILYDAIEVVTLRS